MEKHRVLKDWHSKVAKHKEIVSKEFGYGKTPSFEELALQILAKHKEIVRTHHSRYLDM